jgi:hypothetical protein
MPCHLPLPVRAAARSAGSRLSWNRRHRSRNPDLTRSIAFAALLLCASAATASVSGQTTPQLVQSQSVGTPPGTQFSNQQCTFSFSQAIGSGDTVVGFVHSSNYNDSYPMTPDWVADNNGVYYTLAGAVQWLPWQEDINIFYLTNIQGNPTSFTFDFSNYPNSGNTVGGPCNVGFSEYSGVGSVVVAGPTLTNGADPSITVTPTTTSLIWAFAANYGGDAFSYLQNSGYTGLINNFSQDDIGVWGSNATVGAGAQTLTWTNPNYSPCTGQASGVTCPAMLAVVALQSTSPSSPSSPSPSPSPSSPSPPRPTPSLPSLPLPSLPFPRSH